MPPSRASARGPTGRRRARARPSRPGSRWRSNSTSPADEEGALMSPTRRRFLSSVAALPLAPAMAAQVAPAKATSAAAPPGPDPVADALLEVVKRRYGTKLAAGDETAIRKAL